MVVYDVPKKAKFTCKWLRTVVGCRPRSLNIGLMIGGECLNPRSRAEKNMQIILHHYMLLDVLESSDN